MEDGIGNAFACIYTVLVTIIEVYTKDDAFCKY
jgi:hypothetical protein